MTLRFIDQEDQSPQGDNYSPDMVAGLDLRGLYRQADKALGGWLPGGGTANPLSKPVRQAVQTLGDPVGAAEKNATVARPKPAARPYQRIPGATPSTPALDAKGNLTKEGKALLAQLGINPSIVTDINQTNPVSVAQARLFPEYGGRAHANPMANQIYLPIDRYNNTLAVLAHEGAHINRSRSPAPVEGMFGRLPGDVARGLKAATGGDFSPAAGPLAPLRIAGGFLTARSDAREEDYAEALAQEVMRGTTGTPVNAAGNTIAPGAPSGYSKNLYSTGMTDVRDGLIDLMIPASLKETARDLLSQASRNLSAPAGPPAPSYNARQLAIGPKLQEAEYDLLMEQQNNPNSPRAAQLAKIVKQLRNDMAAAGR